MTFAITSNPETDFPRAPLDDQYVGFKATDSLAILAFTPGKAHP
jgi:hypothetical protein